MTVALRTIDDLLADLRRARGFDAWEVLAAKVGLLVGWFRGERLDAAVVGLSGGIDSAVVLGLLLRAMAEPDSPLRRVVAVTIPIDGPGATGQARATDRASRVANAFGAELWTVPLGGVHAGLVDALGTSAGLPLDPWAAGQMLSVERTPVLYGAAATLRSAGLASVVVGTTNRDEGAYLGFFGKASDGMVDVQPISDLHKSEVVALAELLGVPDEVVRAAPSGDVWDGRTDLEMIGADYDDVELVLRLRELGRDPLLVAATLGEAEGGRLAEAAAAVERLHAVNAHKYRVGDPAVHLDVMPRAVPGGWRGPAVERSPEVAPVGLPGGWTPPAVALDPVGFPRSCVGTGPIEADGVLTSGDCARLIDALAGAPSEPVGVTGIVGSSGVGSVRSSAFSEALAADLWQRVLPVVPSVRFLGPFDPGEGHATPSRTGHRTWRAVGLSPLLRFMRYSDGGRHLCHYDAAFEYGDGRRTLMSIVFFLTGDGTGGLGGALRFVRDGQEGVPIWERDHADWSRDTRDDEVVHAVHPRAGSVVLFDHRWCHDVERWLGADDRVVIRGDVVFEPVLDGRGLG